MKIGKKLAFGLMLVAFCVWLVPTVMAERVTETAEFTGHGSLTVPADSVTIGFSLEFTGNTEAEARAAGSQVLEALRKAYPERDKRTVLREECFGSWYRDDIGQYSVSYSMTLWSGQPDKVPALRQELERLGVTSVNYVACQLSDTSPYHDQLIRLALADARSKLAALEGTYTLTSVREQGVYCWGSESGNRPGEVTLVCDVTAVYDVTGE